MTAAHARVYLYACLLPFLLFFFLGAAVRSTCGGCLGVFRVWLFLCIVRTMWVYVPAITLATVDPAPLLGDLREFNRRCAAASGCVLCRRGHGFSVGKPLLRLAIHFMPCCVEERSIVDRAGIVCGHGRVKCQRTEQLVGALLVWEGGVALPLSIVLASCTRTRGSQKSTWA